MNASGQEPRGTLFHYLYFPSEVVANKVAALIRRQGHGTIVRPAAKGDDWLVLVKDAEIRTDEVLAPREREFIDLTTSHGGEYDGYESAV